MPCEALGFGTELLQQLVPLQSIAMLQKVLNHVVPIGMPSDWSWGPL